MAQNPEPAADPLREHMELVARLAGLVAGEDQQRFMLAFESLANQVDGFLAAPGNEGPRRGRSLGLQPAGPAQARARARPGGASRDGAGRR